jgi:hypothetical protein
MKSGRWWLSTASLCAALVAAPVAPAVTYEPVPSFCDGGVVHDYLKPLKQMGKLHAPHPSGRIGFGPPALRLRLFPGLLVGEDSAGYWLYLERRRGSVRLGWEVTTTLVRVDWRGRELSIRARGHRRIGSLDSRLGVVGQFEIDGRPGVYRFTLEIARRSGEKLAQFSRYLRAVRPTRKARLTLDAASYEPGETVFGRIENFGTTTVHFGAPYAIERFDGSGWVRAPESPRGPWIMPLYGLGPGEASPHCSRFWIPPTMPAGRYRMSKDVDFATRRLRPPEFEIPVSGEFEVLLGPRSSGDTGL